MFQHAKLGKWGWPLCCDDSTLLSVKLSAYYILLGMLGHPPHTALLPCIRRWSSRGGKPPQIFEQDNIRLILIFGTLLHLSKMTTYGLGLHSIGLNMLFCFLLRHADLYNLDIPHAIPLSGPNGTFFGYSVLLHKHQQQTWCVLIFLCDSNVNYWVSNRRECLF